VDVVGSRPDVSAVANETLAVRRRSTWIGIVLATIALALAAYVYMFRGP
jgi:hypothetical protein